MTEENQQPVPPSSPTPANESVVKESGSRGLTGSGQLIRDPLMAQDIAFHDIQAAGVPVMQIQNAADPQPQPPSEGS